MHIYTFFSSNHSPVVVKKLYRTHHIAPCLHSMNAHRYRIPSFLCAYLTPLYFILRLRFFAFHLLRQYNSMFTFIFEVERHWDRICGPSQMGVMALMDIAEKLIFQIKIDMDQKNGNSVSNDIR